MRIEAAGKTWIVEERELARGVEAGEGRFYGVTFRNETSDDDVLQVRWVLRPGRLTPHDARDLFDRAGQRLWRDRRDGRVYRVYLETAGADLSPRPGGPGLVESVCFQAEDGTVCTAWSLDRGLGFATDDQLTSLLDAAREI